MKLSSHERALSAGLSATRRAMGIPVTYTRGATTLTVSKAVQGDTFKAELDGVIVEFQDWLISVADLSPLSAPEIGDLITRNIDGTDYVFTLEHPSEGRPSWDWSDTGKTQYRIHTRKDGAAAFDVPQKNGFDLSGTEMRYD